MQLRWGSATDVGMVRESNQDSFLTADPLFAVADGMGGHAGGEIASATAVEILKSTFTEPTKESLLEAVRRANAKIWDRAQVDENLHNMGTTVTVAAYVNDDEAGGDRVLIANVGDSRGYILRNEEFQQVTTDHSLVEEMLAAGEIDAAEAETHPRRNILTRALGVEPVIAADIFEIEPQHGDRILLCSDGLVREVADDHIASILRRLRNPEEAAKELVKVAKQNGGHDNITVVIVDIEDETVSPFATPGKEGAALNPSRTSGRSKLATPRSITPRVVMFIIAIVALLSLAVGSVVWYARGTFFVGLYGDNVAVYRGRPDTVLWFKPTLVETTNINTVDILPNDVDRLREGTVRTSIEDSRAYVRTLLEKSAEARQVAGNGEAPPEPVFSQPRSPEAEQQSTTTTAAEAPPQTPEVSAARS